MFDGLKSLISRQAGRKGRPVAVKDSGAKPAVWQGARFVPIRVVRGKYDAAQTTAENRRHWANADLLAADAAASPEIRRILRSRARYEVANGGYLAGIVQTLANDVIGSGPRLQMLVTPDRLNQQIETEFANWAVASRLGHKLRTMRQAKATDGEAFGLLFTNPALPHAVKLDLALIEADQVASPLLSLAKKTPSSRGRIADGIVFDEYGNPIAYCILKQHPGSGSAWTASGADYDEVAAEYVIHWFRADRPGQTRGVPEMVSSLELFGQLRRYRLAVLGAAETAADLALVMHTSLPADGNARPVEPMAEMELAPRMGIFAPEGWEPSQLKAEQPTTSFQEYCNGMINEAARPFNMPKNVALCDSSGYNYASGRLDHQTYFKSIGVERTHLEAVVLDRILTAWLEEAVRVFGLSQTVLAAWPVAHQWFWPAREHVDPAKEASAQFTRVWATGTSTLAAEYAAQGKDWEVETRQRGKEVALLKELALPVPQPPGTAATKAPASDEKDEQDEE